jgi:hypothetical protein
MKRTLGSWLVLLVLVGATTAARRVGEARAQGGAPVRVAALPAVPFLEVAALGYREAAADAAWLQAVQYFGEYRQGGNDLSAFRHSIDAVNALDPRFQHAHVFGAFVLASERHDLQGALAVLRRGARDNPDSPVCPFEMGFLSYVEGGDEEAALHYLRLAAGRPGGHERAQRFMAFLHRRLGRLETSWLLWNDLYRRTRDPALRAVAAASMRRIESLRARPSAPEVGGGGEGNLR